MARARHSLPPAAAILALADGQGRLAVRASPNASSDAVILPASANDDRLVVRTTASPEHGKANDAVLRLIAKALGQPISNLQLVRGATQRDKLIRIIASKA